MSDNSQIEWCDATWNVVTGCVEVSPGCDNCYAKTFSERFRGVPGHHFESGFDLTLRPERLGLPFTWRKPRRVFVNSMSDLFHQDVPDEFIARAFAVMAATPQHTYQILTKRHARMRSLLGDDGFVDEVAEERVGASVIDGVDDCGPEGWDWWPLPNVWLGVSVEDQKWADIRIPALLQTPATVRWLSCEPLLGQVSLDAFLHWRPTGRNFALEPLPPSAAEACGLPTLHWLVAGGESGSGRREMDLQWMRHIVGQCQAAGVPVFVKQDSGPRPGMQGRIPDELWLKEFPAEVPA